MRQLRVITAREFMRVAISADHGYWLEFGTRKEAESFRAKCYAARTHARNLSDKVNMDNPSYTRLCSYDELVFDIRPAGEGWRVAAIKTPIDPAEVRHGGLTAEEAAEIRGAPRLLVDDPPQAIAQALGKAPDMETPSVDVDEELPPDPFGASKDSES